MLGLFRFIKVKLEKKKLFFHIFSSDYHTVLFENKQNRPTSCLK